MSARDLIFGYKETNPDVRNAFEDETAAAEASFPNLIDSLGNGPTNGMIKPTDLVTPIMNNWKGLQSGTTYKMMTGNTVGGTANLAGVILETNPGTTSSPNSQVTFDDWTSASTTPIDEWAQFNDLWYNDQYQANPVTFYNSLASANQVGGYRIPTLTMGQDQNSIYFETRN